MPRAVGQCFNPTVFAGTHSAGQDAPALRQAGSPPLLRLPSGRAVSPWSGICAKVRDSDLGN